MQETIVITPKPLPTPAPGNDAATDHRSRHMALALSRRAPAFTRFAVDALGRGNLDRNPVLGEPDAVPGIELDGGSVYTLDGSPVWQVTCGESALVLRSFRVGGREVPPFVLAFNQKANHATLLGLMEPGTRRMSLPCVLHLPDMGSVRITCDQAGVTLEYDARRFVEPLPFVRVAFPPAGDRLDHVEYRLEVAAIHPELPGIENNPLYDGFRRDFLNIFQVNPRIQMLANNASSDACTFTLFEYAAVARHAPPLADGLTCLDLVRMTLDRYLSGAKGYGQAGYACGGDVEGDLVPWVTPWTSLDSLPSLLVAACDYADGSGDRAWAQANYGRLTGLMREMLAGDSDGDGLLEYPGSGNSGDRPAAERRPSNWWDTINFGHKDAFSNAIAHHAIERFSALAHQLGDAAGAESFAAAAARLRAAYVPAFLNPETGLLAGWKSADGGLHDYWFTFVQGLAITYGLVDDATANAIMDRLIEKFAEVGYTNFRLGLPGNLKAVRKCDYIYHDTPPDVHGVPLLDDGSDGFQYYENGGATGCWAYFTIKAFFRLGRAGDARKILHPMLEGYAAGEFQGFDATGRSLDWRDWRGGAHGYEGLLVDNYLTLLAVLDDVQAQG